MKKILSLTLCIMLTLSFSAIFSYADEDITLEEATVLVKGLSEMHGMLFHDRGMDVANGYADDELNKELNDAFSRDSVNFLLPIDGYKSVSDWERYFKSFLTDEYVSTHNMFIGGLYAYEGKVYIGEAHSLAPCYPVINDDDICSAVRLVDGNTVIVTALYDYENTCEYEVDFEYTENGWRISGGDAVHQFLKVMPKNPETGDGVTVIIACLAVSLLGVGITVKKRRHLNIV